MFLLQHGRGIRRALRFPCHRVERKAYTQSSLGINHGGKFIKLWPGQYGVFDSGSRLLNGRSFIFVTLS